MTKYDVYQEIFIKAGKAGQQALEECTPTPMVVQQHENPLNDDSPVVKSWRVSGGVCGFAWVHIAPGNCSFARWLRKKNYAGKAYRGGVDIWINAGGQSLERKQAYAHAMAAYLNDHKSEIGNPKYIYAQSRID